MSNLIKTEELISLLREAKANGAISLGIAKNGCIKGLDEDFNSVVEININEKKMTDLNKSGSKIYDDNKTHSVSPVTQKVPKSQRRTGDYSIKFNGEVHQCSSKKDVLVWSLREIETKFPGTFLKLQNIVPKTKRIVSKNRNDLYKNKDAEFAKKNSVQILGEWWIATNNSGAEIERWLSRACEQAGLLYHIDLYISPQL